MRYAKLLLISLIVVSFFGCASTQIPTAADTAAHASYDGNTQNSGIIAVTEEGFVVSPHFLERYDALVELYGKKFNPALSKGEGVKGNVINREAMTKFLLMNKWRRSGIG